MRWPHEVRDPADLKFPPDSGVSEAELKMANQLIKSQTRAFVSEDYHDTYTEKLEAIIKEKVKGKTPKARGQKPKQTPSKDLMEALKASLEKS
jgi:DNA end-binding protein Ku